MGDALDALQWWRQFSDEPLVRLVERAVVTIPRTRIAVDGAGQAHAGTVTTELHLFPKINVTAPQSDSHTGLPHPVNAQIATNFSSGVTP